MAHESGNNFFSSRRRHTRWNCDWSSDVCSSDLGHAGAGTRRGRPRGRLPSRPPRAVKLARLVELGEAMHQELGREYYLTGAGLKNEPAFKAIYDRFAVLVPDEALAAARASGSAQLVEWVVGIRIGRLVASLEEAQLRWEQAAVVRAC